MMAFKRIFVWQGGRLEISSFFMSIALFIAVYSNAAISATLTIAYDDWLPVTGVPQSDPEGYAHKILKRTLGKRYTLVFKSIPYDRSLEMLETGHIDILLATAKQDFEDPNSVIFPQKTIGDSTFRFFVKQTSPWKFEGAGSLDGVRLGLEQGEVYPELDSVKNKRFDYISGDSTTTRSLKKLIHGRLDAYYQDANVARYNAMKMNISGQIKSAGSAAESTPLYIAISRHTPEAISIADEFDKNIQLQRESGQLTELLNTYNLTDWEQ